MAEERAQRRLVAILAADVVGYSRLMHLDEAGTLAALKARRSEVLQPVVSKHRGRIVKLMGDGVLIEFASAVDAVECAVQLQEAMSAANAGSPDDKWIVLRIGVNLGDVMVEGSELYGDGVNIAARLEALADPGRIFVSQTVVSHVKGKTKLDFEDLGEQTLKNMAEPVRVYRVSSTAPSANLATPGEGAHLPKPSIAVLPFTNMSSDPEQQYLSDGITEDIITELSRYRELLVIARNSSFQYRDKSVDMRRVGQELGVQYLVEGSIRKGDNRLRITAQLIDVGTGSHLWAERYDRDLKDVFEIQDDVTRTIVATLALRVTRRGAEKARRKQTTHWAAYDYFLKGQEHLNRYESEKAIPLLLKAIELDPDYAQACALLADCYLSCYFVDSNMETLDTACTYAQKALSIDDDDGMSHYAMGFVQMYYHHFDLAEMHLLRAVDLNPNSVYFAIFYSYWLAMVGRAEEALNNLDAAARRDPLRFAGFYQTRMYALFTAKRYQEAIHTFNQIEPKQYWDYAYVAAGYAYLERQLDAHAAAAEVLRLRPGFSISAFDKILCFRNTDDLEHLHVGMRKAGLPD